MNLIRERTNGYLVVKVCVDRFIGPNSIELKDFIISLVKEGESQFVIDLSPVDFHGFQRCCRTVTYFKISTCGQFSSFCRTLSEGCAAF